MCCWSRLLDRSFSNFLLVHNNNDNYCSFAWGEDDSELSKMYRGNNLFYVSLYVTQHVPYIPNLNVWCLLFANMYPFTFSVLLFSCSLATITSFNEATSRPFLVHRSVPVSRKCRWCRAPIVPKSTRASSSFSTPLRTGESIWTFRTARSRLPRAKACESTMTWRITTNDSSRKRESEISRRNSASVWLEREGAPRPLTNSWNGSSTEDSTMTRRRSFRKGPSQENKHNLTLILLMTLPMTLPFSRISSISTLLLPLPIILLIKLGGL